MTTGDLRSIVRSALRRTGLLPAFQRIRRAVFFRRTEPDHYLDLFRAFVAPGSLVFDIGASIGARTAVFLALGAKVVAVEPNPACARLIRERYKSSRLLVEEVAVGDRVGVGELRVAAQHELSTMTGGWFDDDQLVETVSVPMTTIDQLIATHGTPQFIKIDVEGYERHVLAGMTEPVACLSFEFHTWDLQAVEQCLDLLGAVDAEFNFAWEETPQLVMRGWGDRERLFAEIDRSLSALSARGERAPNYGDIYVRRRP